MVVVVVKVPETRTDVTNVCTIEYGVGATGVGIEVIGIAFGVEVGVKGEVVLVATGVTEL
jgi:hypothetical protein